jgi:membrane-associated phospholipid phosphatase
MSEPDGEGPLGTIKEAAEESAKVETSPPPARRHRTLLFQAGLIVAIILFATLAFLAKTTPYFPIDLQISHAIQTIDSPFFAGLMTIVSWPGFMPQSVIIPLLIAFVLYLYRLRWEALTSLVAAGSSGLINDLVKNIIERPRPPANLVDVFSALTSYSFPSGHVMFYTISFGFVWYLAYTLLKPSWKRGFLLVFFGSLILLVGVSRIYLGHHWPSDVLGAYLLGGLVLMAIILLYRWGKKRFFLHQPVARHD